MKQKDIATIIVIAALAGIISFFIANKVFVTSESRQQKAEQVDVISAEVSTPDERFFNANSINPTRDTSLSGTNDSPFNGTSQ